MMDWPLNLTAAGLPRPVSFDRWPTEAKETAWYIAAHVGHNELQAIQLCALDLSIDFAAPPHPRAAEAILDWHERICPRFMTRKRHPIRRDLVTMRPAPRWLISENRLLAAFGWLPAGHGYQHPWLHNADLPDAELHPGLIPAFTLWRLLSADHAGRRKTRVRAI